MEALEFFGMSGLADSIDPILRSLCPRVCVGCDYALEGLAAPATCPECGMVEDPAVLTLIGWTRKPTERLELYQIVTAAVGYGLIAIYILFVGGGDRWPAFLLVAGVTLPIVYTRSLAFLRGVQGPPMRLRLTPHGFQRRLGPGPLKLRPWLRDVSVNVQAEGARLRKIQTQWVGNLTFRDTRNFFHFFFEGSADAGMLLKEQLRRWIERA